MKLAINAAAATELIQDGATIMVGGFMGVGAPHRLLEALAERGVSGLTLISNDAARPGVGVGKLLSAGSVRRLITSHIGLNPEAQELAQSGELELEFVPQGTLVERIRAGGVGLGGVLTPTGLGTDVAEGKTVISCNGEDFLLETPLKADFSLIAAYQSDYAGNLSYMLTARNFNPVMAMAARTVIAEPDRIVPTGVIPPDGVITPGVLVDHVLERSKGNE